MTFEELNLQMGGVDSKHRDQLIANCHLYAIDHPYTVLQTIPREHRLQYIKKAIPHYIEKEMSPGHLAYMSKKAFQAEIQRKNLSMIREVCDYAEGVYRAEQLWDLATNRDFKNPSVLPDIPPDIKSFYVKDALREVTCSEGGHFSVFVQLNKETPRTNDEYLNQIDYSALCAYTKSYSKRT